RSTPAAGAVRARSRTATAPIADPVPNAPAPDEAPPGPTAGGLSIVEEGDPAEGLERLRSEEIGECVRCKLSAGSRTIVFGSGDPRARLMFVGEGPGADEDAQGLPFVGRAGQLLTK